MPPHSTLDSTQEAVYPLTLFDNMAAGIVIVMGWLVEGTVDVCRLEHAVDSVVMDWRLLGGRLEKNEVDHLLSIRITWLLIGNVNASTISGNVSNAGTLGGIPGWLQALCVYNSDLKKTSFALCTPSLRTIS